MTSAPSSTSPSTKCEWVLVLNCGSSSAKFALVNATTGERLYTGLAERLTTPDATLVVKNGTQKHDVALTDASHRGAIGAILDTLRSLGSPEPVGVGHRILHGGEQLYESSLATPEVVKQIEACNDLGPLHNPPQLDGLDAAQQFLPHLPHVVVFDTAFGHTIPEKAYRYAVPTEWYTQLGVRRYGFHGTSHRFVSAKATEILGNPDARVVVAHLGNGCSLTAVRGGICQETSMGLTPLEGLVMGTRSGDVDPALVQFVSDHLDIPMHEVTRKLNYESGLLALSGVSNDMRTVITAADEGNPDAELALQVFCYRLAKYVASYVVPLGGLDALVFTGGIGENSAPIRARVLQELAPLGFSVDEAANAQAGADTKGRITQDSSTVALVVPTDEELLIAQDTLALLQRTR